MAYYPTTIKSVGNGTAVDASGKTLKFIANLPCQAGDTVWTDGKVIFGNTTRKGAPLMEEPPRGIPVWYKTMDEPPEEKRGYFTSRGRYKNYRIAVDEATTEYPDLWIANDKQKYEHNRELHGKTGRVIDVDVIDGELIRAELQIGNESDLHDYDYHWGCYRGDTTTYYVPNFGRIAVEFPEDDFSNVRGFQPMQWFGEFREFYYKQRYYMVTPSYETGYFHGFDPQYDGYAVVLRQCRFFLKSDILDHSMADNEFIKQCKIKISKDGNEDSVIKLADLLKPFEDDVKDEVDLLTGRESVKHIKSRAIVQNFKLLPDDAWEMIVEVEIWGSNTFYNETREHDHSTYPPTFITTPFHISTTTSHNRLLLKFKSDNTCEELFSWKFLCPLLLRDSSFGAYYTDVRPEETESVEGAWIIRTAVSSLGDDANQDGVPDEHKIYYTDIWRDYDSRRDRTDLEYGTPINGAQEGNDTFKFPIQDGYQAEITFGGTDEEHIGELRDLRKDGVVPSAIGSGIWHLNSVYDEDGRQIFGDIFDNENNAHKLNMSLVELKNGDYLFGVHEDKKRGIEGALYQIIEGEAEQLGTGLKNFRLRELKKMTKAKK